MAARASKLSSKKSSTLDLNPMTAAEVEQVVLAREHVASGTLGPGAGATLNGDGEPTVRIKVLTGPSTPSAEDVWKDSSVDPISLAKCGDLTT